MSRRVGDVRDLLERGAALQRAMENFLANNNSPLQSGDTRQLQPSKVLDYFAGNTMTDLEEAQILHSLGNLPTVTTLLDVLQDDQDYCETVHAREMSVSQQTAKNAEKFCNLSLPCVLRLKVRSLELTDSGQKALSTPAQGARPPSFLLEYTPPRGSSVVHHHPIHMCAKLAGRAIVFGQEKIHSCESKVPIEFKVLFRYGNQVTPTLLGSAIFDWTQALDAPSGSSEWSLGVYHVKTRSKQGALKLRVSLEREVESAARRTGKVKRGSDVEQPQPQACQVSAQGEIERADTDVVESAEDKKVSPASSGDPLHSEQLHYTNPIPPSAAEHNAIVLHGLTVISQFRKTTSPESWHPFVVLKAFWMGGDFKSRVIWDDGTPDFKIHESSPVLLSAYFLERCRGQHAVLELWDARAAGDELLGVTKLPLHTFYLAFHDAGVASHLLKGELPVFSVDQWLSVAHPVSGAEVGEVRALLSFGSELQVTRLEHKLGLREFVSPEEHHVPPQLTSPEQTLYFDETHKNHQIEIDLLKISEFPLFSNLEKNIADCYVEYKLPVPTAAGTTHKILVSDIALCGPEPRFRCHHVHVLPLPCTTPLSSFLGVDEPLCTFRVWCRIYHPQLKDVAVAKATLPWSTVKSLEEKQTPVNITLHLPLTIKKSSLTSELHKAGSIKKGHLVLALRYSFSSSDNGDTIPKEVDPSPDVNVNQLVDEAVAMGTQTALQLCDFDLEEEDSVLCLDVAGDPHDLSKLSPLGEQSIECLEASLEADLQLSDRGAASQRTVHLEQDLLAEELLGAGVAGGSKLAPLLPDFPAAASLPHVPCPHPAAPRSFRAHLEVERAVRLPQVSSSALGLAAAPPTTYVTVRDAGSDSLCVSPVVRHSCDPAWDWHCDVTLPVTLLLQDQLQLLLQVWQPLSCSEEPNPVVDTNLYFASVGLPVLLTGLPQISGWFNLLNFAGSCCGQIKVTLTPLESLVAYRLPATVAPRPPLVSLPASPPPQDLPPEPIKLFESLANPFIDLSPTALEEAFQQQLADLDALTCELQSRLSDLSITDPPSLAPHPTPEDCTPCCIPDPVSSLHHAPPLSETPCCGGANCDFPPCPAPQNTPLVEPLQPPWAPEDSQETPSCSALVPSAPPGEESEDSYAELARMLPQLQIPHCLDMLQRFVFEQLLDERLKAGHGSKPDYVCTRRPASPTPSPPTCVTPVLSDSSECEVAVSRQAPEGGNPLEKVTAVAATAEPAESEES